MARWFALGASATLLLIACAQAASQPTASPSPVAVLPRSSATVPATVAATDTAVPPGTTPPTTTATGTLPPAGTPTVLITPVPTQGTSSTATPRKTNGPTNPPGSTATPSKAPTTAPTKTPSHPPTAPPTAKPTKTPTAVPTASPSKPPPTPTKAPTPTPSPTPHWDVAVGQDGSKFTPANFTAPGSGEVVWRWFGRRHNVTIVGSSSSGDKMSGFFSHTFNSPGTYQYYCTLHSSGPGNGMSGTITVNP